jgi:hypothetical protein
MVIPIMASCLLARAAASLFSPTPVYKDFAERLVRDFEEKQNAMEKAEEAKRQAHFAGIDTSESAPAAPEAVNRTSAFQEPSGETTAEEKAADSARDEEPTAQADASKDDPPRRDGG